MKKVFSFVFTFLLVNSGFAHAFGGTVENGGDTIFCRSFDEPNPPPPPDIIVNPPTDPIEYGANPYTFDYIAALVQGHQRDSFIEPKSWSESADRLIKILEKFSPKLAKSFHEFRLSTDQIEFSNGSLAYERSKRSWIPWESKVYLSEGIHEKLPRNCLIQKNVSGIIISMFIYQRTILRSKKRFSGKIQYNYYQPTLKKLAESSAQQYSFMMVHEWLWDHTKEIDVNRRVTAFLHKKELEKMSPSEIRAMLKSMGLKF
jgi:hypothetical protein